MTDTDSGTETKTEIGTRPRHRRRWALIAAGGLAATLTAVTLLATRVSDDERTAPAFELPLLDDDTQTLRLDTFRGTPVVLNFWASWCVPCRREMPAFQAVADQLAGEVAFIGVNHQDSRTAGLNLIEDTGVTYPSGYDPDGDVARQYGLYGIPATVLITADGRVVSTSVGELDSDELSELIAKHLGINP